MPNDDAIDAFWDVLHCPFDVELPAIGASSPVILVDGLHIGKGAHLVLAKSTRSLVSAIVRIQSMIPGRCSVQTLDSEVPCLIYDGVYWKTAGENLHRLFGSGKRAFVGTMNTAVIDCFYFESPVDVRTRILLANEIGVCHRISERRADDFYRAYETGVQHVSEILMTEGIW